MPRSLRGRCRQALVIIISFMMLCMVPYIEGLWFVFRLCVLCVFEVCDVILVCFISCFMFHCFTVLKSALCLFLCLWLSISLLLWSCCFICFGDFVYSSSVYSTYIHVLACLIFIAYQLFICYFVFC